MCGTCEQHRLTYTFTTSQVRPSQLLLLLLAASVCRTEPGADEVLRLKGGTRSELLRPASNGAGKRLSLCCLQGLLVDFLSLKLNSQDQQL